MVCLTADVLRLASRLLPDAPQQPQCMLLLPALCCRHANCSGSASRPDVQDASTGTEDLQSEADQRHVYWPAAQVRLKM